jgi:DNA-binding transcriptional ArsR family regulator
MKSDDHGSQLLVALQHPLRREILKAMVGKTKVSPRQIADQISEPLSNVSYHVRVLREHDAVKLVDQENVRGAVQNFYRMDVTEPWALAALGLTPGGEGTAS